jgi:hypothetical protein
MAKTSYSLMYVRCYQSWEQLQTGLVDGSKCFLSVIVDVGYYWQSSKSYKKEQRLEFQLSVCYLVHVDHTKFLYFLLKSMTIRYFPKFFFIGTRCWLSTEVVFSAYFIVGYEFVILKLSQASSCISRWMASKPTFWKPSVISSLGNWITQKSAVHIMPYLLSHSLLQGSHGWWAELSTLSAWSCFWLVNMLVTGYQAWLTVKPLPLFIEIWLNMNTFNRYNSFTRSQALCPETNMLSN